MKKQRTIRTTRTRNQQALCLDGVCLSRHEAIDWLCRQLDHRTLSPELSRWIALFRIDPEELSEAGLPYETLKALEGRGVFL